MSKKIMHRAMYNQYYNCNVYTTKIFDYNDGVKLDDKSVNECYVINVPCYNLEDISMMETGSPYHSSPMQYWQKFQHAVSIRTSNHKGKQFRYLLATPETDKYVAEQGLIGILKGHITKMPKRHLKVVNVHHRGKWTTTAYKFKKAPMSVDAYVEDKDDSAGILRCVEVRNGMTEETV